LLGAPYNERVPMISPDGKWLAYLSDESGREEVYVQSFPEAGGRRYVNNIGRANYDVYPDNERFLMVEAIAPQKPSTQLNVVLEWFEELKRRVPSK
jgi:Tol biopolymer transport system component